MDRASVLWFGKTTGLGVLLFALAKMAPPEVAEWLQVYSVIAFSAGILWLARYHLI